MKKILTTLFIGCCFLFMTTQIQAQMILHIDDNHCKTGTPPYKILITTKIYLSTDCTGSYCQPTTVAMNSNPFSYVYWDPCEDEPVEGNSVSVRIEKYDDNGQLMCWDEQCITYYPGVNVYMSLH